MKKIAVFSSRYFIDIEKEVNEFLVETNVKFIDIKYNSTITISSYNIAVERYSALLVYEEVLND